MIIYFVIRTLFHMRPSSDDNFFFFLNTLQEHPPFFLTLPKDQPWQNFDTRWLFPLRLFLTFLCTHILTIFRFSARLELKYCCTWKIQILVWCSRSERNKTPLPYRGSFFYPPPLQYVYTIHIYIIHVCSLVWYMYTKSFIQETIRFSFFRFLFFTNAAQNYNFPPCLFIYRIRLWDYLLLPFGI